MPRRRPTGASIVICAARVFENLDPLCDLCALEHAPRELVDLLFVHAPGRRQASRDRLERILEPENLVRGLRRQLPQREAGVLIQALLVRYPWSAGVVGKVLARRSEERERLFAEEPANRR